MRRMTPQELADLLTRIRTLGSMPVHPGPYTWQGYETALKEYVGQPCTIVQVITKSEMYSDDILPIFVVMFADGFTTNAWAEELTAIPIEKE